MSDQDNRQRRDSHQNRGAGGRAGGGRKGSGNRGGRGGYARGEREGRGGRDQVRHNRSNPQRQGFREDRMAQRLSEPCLLYTSDAADE